MSIVARLIAAAAIAAAVMSTAAARAQERLEIDDVDGLLAFFETLDYTPETWEAGVRVVPRIYLMEIGPNWRVNSKTLETLTKKRVFFRLLAPIVLRADELVLDDRARLLRLIDSGQMDEESRQWLRETAQRYRVTEGDVEPDGEALTELTRRLDAVPTSLILAQGAEESGWGTSRFAAEGNALFGQWTWGGKGIKPKEQREDLGDYAIAAFDTPLQSVQAYILNLNSHPAYAELRQRRADMRTAGEELSGHRLAETLTSYSERGEEYVKSLHTIMRVNKLDATDEAVLADGPVWQVYPARN